MANEEETMMTDLLQKNAIPFDDQGQQMYVYLHKILDQNFKHIWFFSEIHHVVSKQLWIKWSLKNMMTKQSEI